MRAVLMILLSLVTWTPAGAERLAKDLASGSSDHRRHHGGGGMIQVAGTLDGATLVLQFSAAFPEAPWHTVTECAAITESPSYCIFNLGEAVVKVSLTSPGASTKVSVWLTGSRGRFFVGVMGGGATSFDAIGAGTNTEALLMGSGGSLAVVDSGTITATAAPFSGVTSGTLTTGTLTLGTGAEMTTSGTGRIARLSVSAPDVFWEAPSAGGALRLRAAAASSSQDLTITPATNPTLRALGGNLIVSNSVGEVFRTANGGGRQAVNFGGTYIWSGSGSPSVVHLSSDNSTGFSNDANGAYMIQASQPKVAAYSNRVELMGCKNFGKITGGLPSGGAECDVFFDSDVKRWCFHTGSGWVQTDDSSTACS